MTSIGAPLVGPDCRASTRPGKGRERRMLLLREGELAHVCPASRSPTNIEIQTRLPPSISCVAWPCIPAVSGSRSRI